MQGLGAWGTGLDCDRLNLNPRVSLSGYYAVILSPACSPGVGAQKTDSALPSFARKGRSKKGTTGRETFSDGQVGGAHGRQGKARPERGEKLAEGEREPSHCRRLSVPFSCSHL